MGNNLRALRASRKMSLRQLAAVTGMDHTVISKIERGEVRLASHHIAKLAPALNKRPEDFVTDDAPITDMERELLDVIRPHSPERLRQIIDFLKGQ